MPNRNYLKHVKNLNAYRSRNIIQQKLNEKEQEIKTNASPTHETRGITQIPTKNRRPYTRIKREEKNTTISYG